MEPDDVEISDKGGVFDKVHVDNTHLENTFEDLFVETYGNDALGFLQKEYSLSLSNGRNAFRNAHFIKGTRPFALYAHQETFLQEMSDARERGINTSLVVEPTGTGKSQIAIEYIYWFYKEGKIDLVLEMVSSIRIKADWEAKQEPFHDRLDVTIELYNRSYLRRNHTAEDYFDYLLFFWTVLTNVIGRCYVCAVLLNLMGHIRRAFSILLAIS